jgi:hypothetical protein
MDPKWGDNDGIAARDFQAQAGFEPVIEQTANAIV